MSRQCHCEFIRNITHTYTHSRDTHSCDNQLNHNEAKRRWWRRENSRAANLAHFRPTLSDKTALIRSPARFSTFPLPPPSPPRRLHLPYLSRREPITTYTRFRGIEIIRATRKFSERKRREGEKNKSESEMQISFSPEIRSGEENEGPQRVAENAAM